MSVPVCVSMRLQSVICVLFHAKGTVHVMQVVSARIIASAQCQHGRWQRHRSLKGPNLLHPPKCPVVPVDVHAGFVFVKQAWDSAHVIVLPASL